MSFQRAATLSKLSHSVRTLYFCQRFPSISLEASLLNKLSGKKSNWLGSARCRDVSSAVSKEDFVSFGSQPLLPPPPALAIVISGPSGVGKDAVIRRLQEKRPDLYFVVTATSRAMRPGEKDGVDYFFVTKETFEQWILEGKLLEHAVVYGEYKGIPKQQVEEALSNDTDVILRVDVQGAATMRRLLPGMVSIFLVADTEEELVKRLMDRKTEPPEKMKVRIETAREELSHLNTFDYVVVNRDGRMEDTVERIEAIIHAEKSKVSRNLKSSS